MKSDGKWGFVDTSCRYVITPQFDEAGDFEGDLAAVRLGEAWGYIDPDGVYVWSPTR